MNTESFNILDDFKKGNLDDFYEQYYAPLWAFAVRCLGAQREYLAEDCVQNSIYKAWERRTTFANVFTLRSFLYLSIKNEAISYWRKSNSNQNYLKSIQNVDECEFIEVELATLLFNAIKKLPEMHQKVIDLCFMQGLKNAEVAEVLLLSESSIKKYKAKALDMLKEYIDPNTLFYITLFTLEIDEIISFFFSVV